MKNRTVLVTGATAGIGKVTARELLKQGARVVIVGRNPEKTEKVLQELRAVSPNVHALLADLSSLGEVRKLAAQFNEQFGVLHVLVNNAGSMNPLFERTVDGFERTFATNHLAYFLLANLLIPALEKGANESGKNSRIVNVASGAHAMGPMQFDNLNAEKSYSTWRAYGMSKLANILFTRDLARRLAGKPIVVNALHPGFVASEFLNKGGFWSFIRPLANVFAVSEESGAATSIFLASDPSVESDSGKYFDKCREVNPKRHAQDDLAARRLWDESAKMVGLSAAETAA